MVGQHVRASLAHVSTLLLDIPAPVFAAAWTRQRGGDILFVHLAAAPGRSALRREIAASLRDAGIERVRVRFHDAAQLHAPRSLERLVARFAGDEIAYDPTGAIAGARALVAAGQALRTSLAEKLHGLYFAPRQRIFYVALKADRLAAGDKVKVASLAEVERAVAVAMTAAFAATPEDCPAVRVGFGLPAAGLVAVDGRSLLSWRAHVGRTVRRLWKPITLAALFGVGLAGSAQARDAAVSETNLKVTGLAGQVSGDGAWVFGGALTAPLGEFTGVQLEGAGSGVNGDSVWGAGGHIFTRDPDKYLLGLFAAYSKETDFNVDIGRIGSEAEIYLNQVSLLAQAGYQFSDKNADGAFGKLDLRWYATDNFAVTVGGNFAQNASQGHLEVEFMPGFSALPGLAFNIKGALGADDFNSVLGGITYYFGSNASLKDRQRRQDPDTALYSLFQSVEAERGKLEALYGPAHHH